MAQDIIELTSDESDGEGYIDTRTILKPVIVVDA